MKLGGNTEHFVLYRRKCLFYFKEVIMGDKFLEMSEKVKKKLGEIKTLQELQDLKVKYLGKKGEITSMLKGLGGMAPEERPIFGQKVNSLREELEKAMERRERDVKEKLMEQKLQKEKIDVTMPGKNIELRFDSSNYTGYPRSRRNIFRNGIQYCRWSRSRNCDL